MGDPGSTNFSIVIQQRLQSSTSEIQKSIWKGLLEWTIRDPGTPAVTLQGQIRCEVLSPVINNEPEVNGNSWPSKLPMILLPVPVVSSLGGTNFVNAGKIIFKMEDGEAEQLLKRKMGEGKVGLVHAFSPSLHACVLLYCSQATAYIGLIPTDQIGFATQIQSVIERLKSDKRLRIGSGVTSSPTPQQQTTIPTPISTVGGIGGIIQVLQQLQQRLQMSSTVSLINTQPPSVGPSPTVSQQQTSQITSTTVLQSSSSTQQYTPILDKLKQEYENRHEGLQKALKQAEHLQGLYVLQQATKSLPGTSQISEGPYAKQIKSIKATMAANVQMAKAAIRQAVRPRIHVPQAVANFISTEGCLPPFEISGTVPVPPDWDVHLQGPHHALTNFLRTPVGSSLAEYGIIQAMLEPLCCISKIDRVINPKLWNKFVEQRKELMISKSEDLELMRTFGLSDPEIQIRAHININFDKDDSITPYSDNIGLLFHGTRGDLDKILTEGLDDRVGRESRALLGRGIYFADDPAKSALYDGHGGILLLCLVYLGDCLNVDSWSTQKKMDLVKEPEKANEQKRNHTDLTFDSITARPRDMNEYVIYNRSQCYPLYVIEYTKGEGPVNYNNLTHARAGIPPFGWESSPPSIVTTWPFFAQTIFKQMAPLVTPPGENGNNQVEQNGREGVEVQLGTLRELGFLDEELNKRLLKKCKYNLEEVIDQILTSAEPQPSTSAGVVCRPMAGGKRKAEPIPGPSSAAVTDGGTSTEMEEQCVICYVEYPTDAGTWKAHPSNELNIKMVKTSTHWKTLECCKRKLCVGCHSQMETTRTTMAGETHTFLKCPLCTFCTGIEIGTCPDGTMTVIEPQGMTAAGYEDCGVLRVRYRFHSPPGLMREAYFPSTPEGKKVVDLLRIAWDRRLCFTIGTSLTSGKQNVLVWNNIPHKTSLVGGPPKHGYPDPTYLQRVQDALAQFGIT